MSHPYRTLGVPRGVCEICEREPRSHEMRVRTTRWHIASQEDVYVCNVCRLALVFGVADSEMFEERWNGYPHGHPLHPWSHDDRPFSFGAALGWFETRGRREQ